MGFFQAISYLKVRLERTKKQGECQTHADKSTFAKFPFKSENVRFVMSIL